MASITTWVRLEPRSRDADLLPGVEARLHDPLWLLARQRQLGELTGADAGSAIVARTRGEVASVDAVRGAAGGAWSPIDPARTPLAAAVLAPAAGEAMMRPPLARRVRGGRHLLRLLAAAGLPPTDEALFLEKFPLDAAGAVLDEGERRFLAVMAGRVPDGDAAAAVLGPLLSAPTSQLPAAFGIPAARIAAASDACRRWLGFFATLAETSASPAWRPEELAYRYDVRAGGTVLSAPNDADGSVAWYDVDAGPGDPAPPAAAVVATALPVRVRYRGMPARRYWELEDAAVHWPSIDAGPGDVGRLLFIEFGLTFAGNWLAVPLDVPAGSLARVTSLVVTDTFGVRTLVSSAAELDRQQGSSAWRFLELSRSDALAGPLVFVPPAAVALDGPTVEAVDFARDDVADVVWAVDRTAFGADGRPRTVPAAPPPPEAAGYRLGPAVDPAYHPYCRRLDTDGEVLTPATIPGGPSAPRPDLPPRLRAHALPGRPLRLATRPVVLRASDGTMHVVLRRVRGAAPNAPSQGLAFDVVHEGGG